MLKILHAHSFAITALKFNPSGELLASAGADNMVRLIVVPSSFGGGESACGFMAVAKC
jgi:prolactin regulatory element-binding protein